VEVHSFFLHLIIILMSARFLGEVAAHMGAPSVTGEILAGIIFGPSILGIVEPNQILKLLAEIGVILLLFEVGLETDIGELTRTGAKATVVAIIGFIAPFLLGFGVSYGIFNLNLLVSLFIGGTITATSIGITIRVLTDLDRHHSHESQVVLGAAVMDDIMGIVLLAILYEFSIGGGVSLRNSVRVMAFVVLFLVIAPLLAKLISGWIKKVEAISQTRGVISTTVVSLVLFFAWLAHAVGAPEILGGFAAGLALSRRFVLPMGVAMHSDPDFADRVDNDIKPIIHLFTPIFFVMVGLSLNFRVIDWSSPFIWTFSSIIIFVAFAGKLLGAMIIKDNIYRKFLIGLAMIPRGEVGLIFAELGRASNILNNEIYAALIIVVAVTTVIPPLVMERFYVRYGDRIDGDEEKKV